MHVEAFHDPRTFTLTYVVADPDSRDALVIDPVLDYDPASARVSTESADAVTAYVRREGLRVRALLETHAHADHLSASQVLRRRFPGAPVMIGAGITAVQSVFKDIYDLPDEFRTDGGQFDRLLADGEELRAGTLRAVALATPGHTPGCVSYRIEDAVFTGDALFMPDYGTGRCDFPAGSARELYRSVTGRLYALPDATRVYVGHDYRPGGRPLAYETTIGAQKSGNVQLPAGRGEDDFVAFRSARDATLAAPQLLWPSVQVNIDAGHLPAPGRGGRRFLKIPLALDFDPDA